jgi:hypothetical protein
LMEVCQHFSGVNLAPFKPEIDEFEKVSTSSKSTRSSEQEDFWCLERWERCWMGLRPSPFYAVRFHCWAEDLVRGDHRDHKNPLR